MFVYLPYVFHNRACGIPVVQKQSYDMGIIFSSSNALSLATFGQRQHVDKKSLGLCAYPDHRLALNAVLQESSKKNFIYSFILSLILKKYLLLAYVLKSFKVPAIIGLTLRIIREAGNH